MSSDKMTQQANWADVERAEKTLTELIPSIEPLLNAYPDFPKPGILFRDIMPLFTDPTLVSRLCAAVAEHAQQKLPGDHKITAVVGLEARGFLFGPQIAANLGTKFVPIRKAGKLPGPVLRQSFSKEYGDDAFEMQQGVLGQGDRVLLVDDLLATGGTLTAALHLISSSGGRTSLVFCLVELCSLNGRAALPQELRPPLLTLVKYE